MEVVNVKDFVGGVVEAKRQGVVYIGRPSPLGNPCSSPGYPCPVCNRVHFGPKMVQLTPDRSIPCYRKWLWHLIQNRNPDIISALRVLKPGDLLGCWCSPKACHGDVIIKAWEWCRAQGVFS